MDLSNLAALPIEQIAKKKASELERKLEDAIKASWGADMKALATNLKFIEWFATIIVSTLPKRLTEQEQRDAVIKQGLRVLMLNDVPSQARFTADVNYLFDKKLVRRCSLLTQIIAIIKSFFVKK